MTVTRKPRARRSQDLVIDGSFLNHVPSSKSGQPDQAEHAPLTHHTGRGSQFAPRDAASDQHPHQAHGGPPLCHHEASPPHLLQPAQNGFCSHLGGLYLFLLHHPVAKGELIRPPPVGCWGWWEGCNTGTWPRDGNVERPLPQTSGRAPGTWHWRCGCGPTPMGQEEFAPQSPLSGRGEGEWVWDHRAQPQGYRLKRIQLLSLDLHGG